MDLNKVSLIGAMVRDPESRTAADGQTVTRFSLATHYAWEDRQTRSKRESVDFHDIVAHGKLGDIIRAYVKKGARIYVEGRLRNQATVGKDGARRVARLIVADNLIMLGHRATRGAKPGAGAELLREEPELDDEETGR